MCFSVLLIQGIEVSRYSLHSITEFLFDIDNMASEEAGVLRLDDFKCNEDDFALVESIQNEAKYEGRRLVTNVQVPGNIHRKEFRDFWQNVLKPTAFVMETIENGYSLPLREIPPECHEGNNKSAVNDWEFVCAEVERLESLGCIYKVTKKPHCVLPLSSVFSKKKRLVVDASRHLNPFLLDKAVRLQDHRDIPFVLDQGDWQTSDDLDSGYWHLSILEEHQKYLGIQITNKAGEPVFYQWRVMFLGIKTAVHIFTAILRPIREYVASKGISCLIYLDDIWMKGRNEDQCVKNRAFVREVLGKAGWVVSVSKAVDPAQRILFLGLEICSQSMQFFVPEHKLCRVENTIDKLLKKKRCQLRELASLVGFLQSLNKALGSVVGLMLRACYNFFKVKLELIPSYKVYYVISEEARDELLFWRTNIRKLNGHEINPSLSVTETRLTVVTDSSAQGAFGYAIGFELSDKYKVVLRQSFSEEERNSSSTERELLALKFIYASEISAPWKNMKILHLTDNAGVASIVPHGSPVENLHQLALEVYFGCREKNIGLTVEWRPRSHYLLEHADKGSKSFDSSSFSLDFESFAAMLSFFGELKIDVDCFSEYWNRKATVYFSKDEDPFAAGTNFFSMDLGMGPCYYLFPPVSMVVPAILHLAHFKVSGLFLVPFWPASSFWLRIVPDGCHLVGWVESFLRFRPGIVSDVNIRSMTFKNPLNFDILALKFDFKNANCWGPRIEPRFCLHYGCDLCS